MKTLGTNRCLLIATMSLVTAALPLAVLAQDVVPSDGQAAPQQVTQRRYVSDKLVLSVYSEPDQSSARVATIQTGDVVEELERSGNLVRVRLEDGREGWVGANYLTSDAPAAARLRELLSQQKTATGGPDKQSLEEIAQLKKDKATLQAQVSELQSSVKAQAAQAAEDAQMIATGSSATDDEGVDQAADEGVDEEEELAGAVPTSSGGVWWGWLIAVVLAGALGFASGYQTLARRLRKKFGGLKVY